MSGSKVQDRQARIEQFLLCLKDTPHGVHRYGRKVLVNAGDVVLVINDAEVIEVDAYNNGRTRDMDNG